MHKDESEECVLKQACLWPVVQGLWEDLPKAAFSGLSG